MSEKVFVPLSLKAKAPRLYRTVLRLCREGERHKADKLLALYGLPLLAEDPTRYAHKKHVERARFDLPMDVGSYSLDLCQGGSRYHTLGREAPNRTVNPDGKTSWLSSAVAICESQAPVRATKRAPKSYLRDRPVV